MPPPEEGIDPKASSTEPLHPKQILLQLPNQQLWKSFLDGIGNALGYGVILVIVGFFRELLGSGTLFGMKVLGDPIAKTGLYSIGYENNGFMIIPPAALIVVGIIIWVQRSRNRALIEEA